MKVLIIGLGSIGRKHVMALRSLNPEVRIFALDIREISGDCPGVTQIKSLDEVSSVLFDFAIISNPTSEHKKTISQLIGFGFPLFIEKPLSFTLDMDDVVNAIQKRGISSYVACNLRFLDCIQFIKNHFTQNKSAKLNEINVYCGSYLPEWRPNVNFRDTYSAIAHLGGGVHIDLIHELDYLYWIFGSPKEVQRIFRSQSSLSISSYDYANYSLEYEGFIANVILNYYRRDSKRSLELVFENETWNVNLLTNEVTCNNEIVFSSSQRIQDTYRLQMKYFVRSIEQNISTFNTASNALDVLKICLPS